MTNLPIVVDINNIIGVLRGLSWEVSDILLYYAQLIKVDLEKNNIIQSKSDGSPVTIADLQVNDFVFTSLKEKISNFYWGFLSEENHKLNFNKVGSNTDFLWVLDPLDGTKDFINGTGNYAMHLSLNFQNKPLLGVVLIPEKEELWIADGDKVWSEKKNGLKYKPNNLFKENLNDMTLVISKNHNNKVLKKLVSKLPVKDVISMGSVGCKISSIIKGESDFYISLSLPGKSAPKDWDFAAPEALLRCAGGSITNEKNEPLLYNKNNYLQSGLIIASGNRNNHENLCQIIKENIDNNNLL